MTSLTPEVSHLIKIIRNMANIPFPNVHPHNRDQKIQKAVNEAWHGAHSAYATLIMFSLESIPVVNPEQLKKLIEKIVNLSPPPCPFNPPDAMEYQAVLNAWRSSWGNYRLTIKRMLGGHG